jgi:hypothetical protein
MLLLYCDTMGLQRRIIVVDAIWDGEWIYLSPGQSAVCTGDRNGRCIRDLAGAGLCLSSQ